MEVSLFYLHILRGLGFSVYPTGVRNRSRLDGVPQGAYNGWRVSSFPSSMVRSADVCVGRVHIVNIVTLPNGVKYMVDVGFGGDGATKPMLMSDGPVIRNIGTQDIRLVKDFIPCQTARTDDKKLWIYQYRNGPTREWNSFYCFAEVEFFAPDFGVMNWYTMKRQFQPIRILIVKFLRRPSTTQNGEDEVYGKRMLVDGVVKENLSGKTVTVMECKTEEARVEAVKEWFGILLTDDERMAVRGYVTELRAVDLGAGVAVADS